jgi:hypothetical protein
VVLFPPTQFIALLGIHDPQHLILSTHLGGTLSRICHPPGPIRPPYPHSPDQSSTLAGFTVATMLSDRATGGKEAAEPVVSPSGDPVRAVPGYTEVQEARIVRKLDFNLMLLFFALCMSHWSCVSRLRPGE